jgi:hypothetical protein
MTTVTADNKTICRYAAQALGGHPKVTRFWDNDHKSHVDILECTDAPQKGVKSFATVGLSDWPLIKDKKKLGLRLELVGACRSQFERFDNALSTAAFCIINSKWFCGPGTIFPDVLKMHQCSRTMRHLLFVPPFLWDDELQTLKIKKTEVAWLLAVPISEREMRFAEQHDADQLQDLLEEKQIDIFDLGRKSIV